MLQLVLISFWKLVDSTSQSLRRWCIHYMSCSAEEEGDDTISLPSGAYREPGLVVKTIDHQGWTRYIWCHDDVLKRVTLGYLRCEVACWKSPEEILRERKCHLWWPLCGESFVMWWDLWQCASSQCLAPRSFTSNIHPPNQDGAFEKEDRGFWMVKQLDLQGMRTRQGSEEKFWHIEAPGYSSEIPPLPINTCYISLIFLVLSKSLALYFTQSGVKEANQISLLRLKNVLSEEALRPTTCDDIYENEGLNHAARAE